MRQAGHATVRQVEGGGIEIKHGVVVARHRLHRARRDRPFAVQQRRGEAPGAVGARDGLGQHVVVLRQQPQRHALPRQDVGEPADLHGQPIRATPDSGGEIGAQDHLRRLRRARRAVAGAGNQRIQAGTGRRERVRQRQRGVRGAVHLPAWDRRRALPYGAAGPLGDGAGVPGIDWLAQPVVAQEADDVALGQACECQGDFGQVHGGEADRR